MVSFTLQLLYSRVRSAPDTYWIGSWVGLRAGPNPAEKKTPCPYPESNQGRPVVAIPIELSR
jgi:hypothetical protein